MKRKIIAACLIACMVLVAVTSATLAYFTDKDALKNEFTVGDIDIDLWEYVGDQTEDSDGQPIDPAIPIYVGKGTDKIEESKYGYTNLLPSDEIKKVVHVTNNSTENAAYVRVTVVMNKLVEINNAIDGTYEAENWDAEKIQAVYDDVFPGWGINYSKRTDYPDGSRMWMTPRTGVFAIDTIANLGNYYRIDSMNKFMTDAERAAENGDGIFQYGWGDPMDNLYYQNAVPTTGTRAYAFYFLLAPGEDYVIFDGLKVPAYFDEAQAAMFDGLKIDVYADAIQATGFSGEDAWKDAFAALNDALPVGHWNAK